MSDEINVAWKDGVGYYDTDSGEIISDELARSEPALLRLIERRHEAADQMNAWMRTRMGLDSVISAEMGDVDSIVAGDRKVSRRTGSSKAIDTIGLSAHLVERFDLDMSDEKVLQLLTLITASSGFRLDSLPADLKSIVERFTSTKPGKPWLSYSRVKRQAPVREQVPV